MKFCATFATSHDTYTLQLFAGLGFLASRALPSYCCSFTEPSLSEIVALYEYH